MVSPDYSYVWKTSSWAKRRNLRLHLPKMPVARRSRLNARIALSLFRTGISFGKAWIRCYYYATYRKLASVTLFL